MNRTALLCMLFAVSTLCAADLNGGWSGALQSTDGKSFPWNLDLKQDGDKLSGKMGPDKEEDRRDIQDGTIDGSILHFRVPGGDKSGTEFVVVELRLHDDELTGTMQGKDRQGKMQSFTLSLKRSRPR